MKNQDVYLIFDDSTDLCNLASSHHVWVSNSKLNTPQIESFWKLNNGYFQGHGIISFDKGELSGLLISIDEHHSSDGIEYLKWSNIFVYGIPLEKFEMKQLESLLGSELDISASVAFVRLQRVT
ncbi:TPA: hypothetical protein EYM26_09430 [Candidatus Poribacteria bacterium]|nr:hypothetical protein [Candidatus Poribacteria bacterium]